MPLIIRHLILCVVACTVAVALAVLVLTVMVPATNISYATQVPRSAITVPMIAVVVFWSIVRASGVQLAPVPTFLFGAIAVYGLLYGAGRMIALAGTNSIATVAVTATAVLVLVGAAFVAIRKAADDPTKSQ